MSNEPDVTFSAGAGGLNPPGMYCYPIGYGGSTKEKLVCKYIPYPYVPGRSENSNPVDLPNDAK